MKRIREVAAAMHKDMTDLADWMKKVDAAAKAVLDAAPEDRPRLKLILAQEEIRLNHLTRWFLKKEGYL